MPLIDSGPLRGNYAPDYDGGSIVNLMATLVNARGGHSPHSELRGLPSSELADAHCVLYLVLDGLGLHQLRRHLNANEGLRFFAKHPHQPITTVFPATTAAAVTTFDSGSSPNEHGILSWFLNLPDLGCVGTILRTTTRVGTALVPDDFDLRDYYRVPSYVESVADHRALLSFGEIPNAAYGQVGSRWADRRSYLDLEGLRRTTSAFAAEAGRRFAYVYWPRYDGLCHEVGCDHPQIKAHFDELDQMLAKLVDDLAGTNTVLCILADHGLVTVQPEKCIDLAKVPGLMACLATAPAGDQRQMSFFVRPHKVEAFRTIAAKHLADACVCVTGQELLDAGVFGPGVSHPALESRLGDFVLVCKPDHAIIYTPPGTEPLYMPGSHGGMSAPEIQVPLFVVHCA